MEGDISRESFCALSQLKASLDTSRTVRDEHATLLRAFVESKQLDNTITSLITDLAGSNDNLEVTPDGSIVIYKNDYFALLVSIVHPAPDFVDGFNPDTIASPVTSGVVCFADVNPSTELHFYDLPADTDLTVFDEQQRLSPRITKPCSRLTTVAFSPWRLMEVSSRHGSYVTVKIIERATADFQWVFDCQTGIPLFQVTCSTESARIETLLDLMIRMAGEQVPLEAARDAFEALSHHRHHFIRWKAVQGLGEVDGVSALQRLKEMVLDPHPHIREAALDFCSEYPTSALEGAA